VQRLSTSDVISLLETSPGLSLFPTENRMSPAAMKAIGAAAYGRYPGAEGPGFFYGDTIALDRLYEHCAELACAFFDADTAFVNFLSGLHAAKSVLSAMARAEDAVMIMDPSCGGHYATQEICERLGLKPSFIPFDRQRCEIDIDALAQDCQRTQASLVYFDVSTLLKLPRMDAIRQAVPRSARVCLDASQILGLVPAFPHRIGLETGITSISGSTHKTFPGPQKGIFISNDEDAVGAMGDRMPFEVSSAHANNVGALAITFSELQPDRVRYGRDIVSNAKKLATALSETGFRVSGSDFEFSETHQVWIEPPEGQDPIPWGHALCRAGIRSTVVVLPSSGQPGLRMGVQELTRLGMGGEQMQQIALLLERCLLADTDPAQLRGEVYDIAREFEEVQYVAGGRDGD